MLLKAKELGREAYIDEVFYQTHLRKGSGQFVDERSRRTHVRKSFYCLLFPLNLNDVTNLSLFSLTTRIFN